METRYIDTHCHFYDEAFDNDRKEAVDRALAAGIGKFVLPAINSKTYRAMTETADLLAERGFPCIGLHPTEVGADWESEMAFVRAHLHDRKFYAIGEIGIDKHWSVDFVREQKRVFAEQIEIAAKEDLPIIIHSRDATDDIFDVLEQTRPLAVRGVFHAFSGSYETYRRCLGYGDFKFGIGGVLTYRNAGIAEVVRRMSLRDLVLETDCPYLTPVPHRGRRNESAYIADIAAKLSLLTGESPEAVSSTTTETACKLFKI